jgi:hypothetical protein
MMLRSRRNQILLPFSFWPEIAPREGPNIYELRSYTLKVCQHILINIQLFNLPRVMS